LIHQVHWMNAFQQQMIFVAGALLCAAISAVPDVRNRRIPNIVTGPAILAGLALHAVLGGWSGLGSSALAGLIAGVVFLAFWLAGGLGAGDVKLMIAVGTLSGLSPLPLLLISILLAGAVFALVVSVVHGRLRVTLRNVIELLMHHRRAGLKPHPDLNLKNPKTFRLPFALPAAAGCLLAIYAQIWGWHL
jgi:prepilin peptidase CpaA